MAAPRRKSHDRALGRVAVVTPTSGETHPMHPSTRCPRAIAGALCVLAVALLAGPAAGAPHKIYLDDGFDGAQIRQESMTLLGPAQVWLVNLRWSRWGGRTAAATGTWGRHDCRTGCGSGPLIDRHPVRAVLSQRRLCPKNGVLARDTWFYLKRTIIFTRGVPKGESRRLVAGFGCPKDFGVKNPSSPVPLDVVGLDSGITALAVGSDHACAQSVAGALMCWGFNEQGQLADGTKRRKRPSPMPVEGLSGPVSQVSAGARQTCVVTGAGAAFCWGGNDAGQLGDGTMTDRRKPTPVTGLASGVSQVTAGAYHSCALTTAGGVRCWGNIDELTEPPITPNSTTPVAVAGLETGVAAISAGNRYTCALTDAGGVKCWGFNDDGQLGNATKTYSAQPVDVQGLGSGVVALSAGNAHACAVTDQAALLCWGDNAEGQLGNGTKRSSATPVAVSGLGAGVLSVTAGATHTCAVLTDHTAKCWGLNDFGALGTGNYKPSTTPLAVRGLTEAAGFGLGDEFTCASTAAGTVKCWGDNGLGELGIGKL